MSRIAKAAVYHGPERGFEIASFRLDEPQGDEVLVRVIACTICGSDIHTLTGRRKEPTPSILGHEIIGRIVGFGETANRIDARGITLQIGDRITWSLVASCGSCFYCDRDLPQKCLQLLKYGHSQIQSGKDLLGGLAEYCWLKPGTTIVKIADQLLPALACPANCATATIMGAMESAELKPGQTVLILGAGMLGLTAVAIAKSRLSGQIGCIDFQQSRQRLASELGAAIVGGPDTWSTQSDSYSFGWDVVIETSGASAAVELGLRSTRHGGRFILVGSVWPDAAIQIVPEQIVRRCLTIVGVHNYKPRHLVQAVEFLEGGHSKGLEKLVSSWHRLEDISIAANLACHSMEHIRVGIAFEDESSLWKFS